MKSHSIIYNKWTMNLTHFIRIPLLNQNSSSQIQETLWQVANDPVSATVPPLAYRPLQFLKIGVAALSLPTKESKEHAISLLQDLGKQDWQELFLKAQALRSSAQLSSTMNVARPSNGHVDQFGPRPLVVDLVGLGESLVQRTPQGMNNAMCLYTFIKEPMGALDSFCKAISQAFLAAGLERRDPSEVDTERPNFRQAKAVNTKGLKSGIPKMNPTLKLKGVDLVPRFDARGICGKFKDVVWAKDVHLDRVCISELIPDNIMEDGQQIGYNFRDIVSIPLPGVTGEPRSFEYLRIPHHGPGGRTLGRDRV